MNNVISQAALTPHQPARGIQRATDTGHEEVNAFGNALDEPEARTEQRRIGTRAQDAGETAADDGRAAENESRDEGEDTGRSVHILTMTGSGQWQFRFVKDGTMGGQAAAEPDGTEARSPVSTVADARDNRVVPETDAGTNGEATAKTPGDGGEIAPQGTSGDAKPSSKTHPDSMPAAQPAPASGGKPSNTTGQTGLDAPELPVPGTDQKTSPRAAAEPRVRALADAVQQQGAGNGGTAEQDGGGGSEAGRGRAGVDPQAGEATVAKAKVIGVQNAPAPAMAMGPAAHGASQTGAELVKSIHADPAFRAAATEAATQAHAGARPEVMHSVKLQLQPASMGTVTATLRLVGDQLAVEIQTDNASAHHRLATDSDSMAKALRTLGYDVDRVSVHQAAPQHGAGNGTDGQTGASGRQNTFHSASSNTGDNPTSQGREKGHDGQHNDGPERERPQGQPDSSRGGLYI